MEKQSKKNILIIRGSCRENGYTNGLLKATVADSQGVTFTVFDPYLQKFEFCNGCDYCKENGACIFRDLDDFFKDFENSDVIVFSTPVYNGGFPAPVKALLDRFQVYYNKFYESGKVQPIKKRRNIILLGAAGRDAKEEFYYMEKLLKRAFTVLNGKYMGGVCCYRTDSSPGYDEALNEFKLLLKRSLADE